MTTMLERYQLHFAAPAPVTSKEQNRLYRKALLEFETHGHLTGEQRQYANLLAVLIEQYEREKYPDADVSPTDLIRELMEANGLRQKDLIDILGGHESVVSEILSGVRPLSRTHIENLSRRFLVSPAAFFPPVVASHGRKHTRERTAEE
ncbi:MAG TPA: hypothetical protein VGS59_05745 [Candidatus Acidoferrales bacterium]|nr:hypothetical protein [Candidatus Acidoferrales bacterium]